MNVSELLDLLKEWDRCCDRATLNVLLSAPVNTRYEVLMKTKAHGLKDPALHIFFSEGRWYLDLLKQLLQDLSTEQRVKLLEVRDFVESTIFHLAIQTDNSNVVEYLLDGLTSAQCYHVLGMRTCRGATTIDKNDTMVHLAVRQNQVNILKAMLAA